MRQADFIATREDVRQLCRLPAEKLMGIKSRQRRLNPPPAWSVVKWLLVDPENVIRRTGTIKRNTPLTQ